MIYDDKGKPLYFRYYDPRVLRVYLPTCNESELEKVFGDVSHFIIEDDGGNAMIRYARLMGQLTENRVRLIA
jgi:hypothetical protein